MRQKDQDYSTKVALYEQKIHLLEMQLREAEEREHNQKKLYDKMFEALDDTQKGSLSSRN